MIHRYLIVPKNTSIIIFLVANAKANNRKKATNNNGWKSSNHSHHSLLNTYKKKTLRKILNKNKMMKGIQSRENVVCIVTLLCNNNTL